MIFSKSTVRIPNRILLFLFAGNPIIKTYPQLRSGDWNMKLRVGMIGTPNSQILLLVHRPLCSFIFKTQCFCAFSICSASIRRLL